MEDRWTKVPRRKPVPNDLRFNDFALQPLRARGTHAEDTHFESQEALSKRPYMKLDEQEMRADHVPKGWVPFYHKQSTLLGFILLFICLMVTLAGLYGYSQTHQGICNAHENDYYLWTYGPTAVLTVVAAFWGQVVYRSKQLMPWKAMLFHAQPIEKSLFLDYVSPIDPVAFYTAVKNAHYTVALAVASSFIFTGLTILSTGLFALQYTDLTIENVSLRTTNQFNLTGFDWSSVDARGTALVYATQYLGLDYPSGTNARYAVQGFDDASGDNMTLSSIVDTFSASLDCEKADLLVTNVTAYSPYGPLFHSGGTFIFNVTSANCTMTNLTFNSETGFDSNSPYNATWDAPWGLGRVMACAEDNMYRLLVSAGFYRTHELWNGTEGDYPITLQGSYNQIFQVVNSTNIICSPRNQIERSKVVKKLSSTSQDSFDSITVIGPSNNSQILDATEVARGVFESINDPSASGFYVNGTQFTYSGDTFFTLLQQQGPSFDTASATNAYWLNEDTLMQQSSALYASIAAQVAALKLLSPTNGTLVGTVTVNESRLFVRVLSFSLMEASLTSLTILAGYLLFSASHPVIDHDPGSISGMATVLSKSMQLAQLIGDEGASPATNIKSTLRDNLYYRNGPKTATMKQGIQILHNDVNVSKTDVGKSMISSHLVQWWQPRMLSLWSRILILLTPLIYIVVLEILYRLSRSNDGLLAINNNSWLHYGWTFVPALLMVCMHMMISSVNFNVKMLTPYSELRRGVKSPHISIRDHPLSRIAFHDLLVFARRRQFAALATTIAVLLAPTLTIVVSGLYMAENYNQSTKIRPLTGWNFNTSHYPNSTLVGNVFDQLNETNPSNNSEYPAALDTTVTDLIVTANLSYPQWTYAGFAYPVVEATGDQGTNGQSAAPPEGLLNMTLPAVRGALNCTVIAHDEVDIKYLTWNSTEGSAVHNESGYWKLAGNRPCSGYSLLPNGDGVNLGVTGCRLALLTTNSTNTLGGCAIQPQGLFLPGQASGPQSFGYFTPFTLLNQTYCPYYGGMIGTMTSEAIEDYTWFVCATNVERVMVETTFNMPNYTISEAYADESTAKRVVANASMYTYNASGVGTSQYFGGPNAALVAGNENVINPNTYLTFYNVSGGQNYDNFFSALVYGRQGVAAGDMLGEANIPRLLSAVENLWQVIIAQTFRTNGVYITANQKDVEAWWPQQQQFEATLMDPNAYRLKQSLVSTRVLQGILAALLACTIAAFLTMDTRKILPNNPSSIAIVASLLTGSEMLNMLAEQNQKGANKQGKGDPWEGYLFSLGWWDRSDGTRRFGIDIGKAEKAS